MRQWTGTALVQVMAWCRTGESHYLNQCWFIVNWTLRNKFQWKLIWNSNFFIQENAFENVICEMATILSRGRWVNSLGPSDDIDLGQHCLRKWLVAWRHQAITWTSDGLISRVSSEQFYKKWWYQISLTHGDRAEMDNLSQMTFSNVFASMIMFEFCLKFHWSLFLRVKLTIFQHWFR